MINRKRNQILIALVLATTAALASRSFGAEESQDSETTAEVKKQADETRAQAPKQETLFRCVPHGHIARQRQIPELTRAHNCQNWHAEASSSAD